MSLIDDIRRDRESGTPGPFSISDDEELWIVAPDGDSAPWVVAIAAADCGPGDATPANARRFGRLWELEEIALAAEALAKAVRGLCAAYVGCNGEDHPAYCGALAALTAYRKTTEGGE